MISVIIPVYNTPKELKKCLASLTRQTFKDFEVVVVDDGSTTKLQITNYKLQNFGLDIKSYEIEHGGAPRARNYGFSKSSGEYVLFCDADIILKEDCLDKMKKVLGENEKVDFVYSNFKYGWKKFKFWEFDIEKLKQNNYINTCSMVRREKVISWDESLNKFQDWDFWLMVVERGGQGKYIPEILFRADIRRGKISNWLPRIAYKFNFLKKVKEYNRLKKIIQEKHNLQVKV